MNRGVLALCAVAFTPVCAYAQGSVIHGETTVRAAGMSGVVVYLVPAAPAAAALPPLTVQMDQRDLRFVPPVIAITPGSTVSFSNSDAIMHNVFSPRQRTGGFDLGTYPKSERRSFTFRDESVHVILCHVHPEMVAYVVVVASPYRGVSDAAGQFRIEGVAAGTYRLRTWHRRLQTVERQVIVPANGDVRVDLSLTDGTPSPPRATERPDPQ
jgi:plastocyanin